MCLDAYFPFAEKLAEAQRKFIALKAELKAYMAHKDQFDPDNKKYSKIPWFADLVDKDARKHKRRFRKLHDLKLAFSEFYLSLILLQNFQNLNFTGFRKILKKHDKVSSNLIDSTRNHFNWNTFIAIRNITLLIFGLCFSALKYGQGK